MKERMTELKRLWQNYEIPLTLVATAIGIVVFIYTTFPTRTELGTHVIQEEQRITEIKSDVKDELQGLEQRMVEDRRILNTILLEVRKR